MLEIVSGSLEDLKIEMKVMQQRKKDEIKDLKKQAKQLAKEKAPVEQRIRIDEKIEVAKRLLERYAPSRVLPIKVGDQVINYLGFTLFLKKVENFQPRAILGSNLLQLNYKVKGNTGTLILHDLAEDFKDFQHIPAARIRNEEA